MQQYYLAYVVNGSNVIICFQMVLDYNSFCLNKSSYRILYKHSSQAMSPKLLDSNFATTAMIQKLSTLRKSCVIENNSFTKLPQIKLQEGPHFVMFDFKLFSVQVKPCIISNNLLYSICDPCFTSDSNCCF